MKDMTWPWSPCYTQMLNVIPGSVYVGHDASYSHRMCFSLFTSTVVSGVQGQSLVIAC